MAVPGDDFVLRLREQQPSLLHARVLDVNITSAAYSAVLVEWAYGTAGSVTLAGFSVLRFDALGKLLWQVSKTLSWPDGSSRGKFVVQSGTLIWNGYHTIVGTGVHADTGDTWTFAVAIDDPAMPGDPPRVMWANHFYSDITLPRPPLITSIAPMALPLRSLISATYRGNNTLLLQIDASGSIESAWTIESAAIQRLRWTKSHGVLAVGTYGFTADSPEGGLVMSFDDANAGLKWASHHTDGSTPFPLRWDDVAEGNKALVFVGHMFDPAGNELSPLMGFSNERGSMEWASIPAAGDDPVRLRRVENHQDVIVSVGPFPTTSAFTICGEARQKPWLMLVNEDRSMQWQKFYRLPAATTGRLESIAWPSYDQVLTGGEFTTAAIPRGLFAASRTVMGHGRASCGADADVTFPQKDLKTFSASVTISNKNVFWLPIPLADGPELVLVEGCLDAQEPPPMP